MCVIGIWGIDFQLAVRFLYDTIGSESIEGTMANSGITWGRKIDGLQKVKRIFW